jgi:hypothetical protein
VGSNVPALYPRYFVTTDGEMLSFAGPKPPPPRPTPTHGYEPTREAAG